MTYYHQNHSGNHERYENKKPNHTSETSRRVTTYDKNGTSYQVTSSTINQDGEEVYAKTSEEIKQDKIKQLENEGVSGNLEGSKRPNEMKLFITRVKPDTTNKELQMFILKNFTDVINVIARKTTMYKNNHYASFVTTVVSKSDIQLEFEDFQDFEWPDDIRVFPGREPGDQGF